MPRPRPSYLHSEHTRHGRRVWYVRKDHGSRIRLRADYGTEAFWSEYRRAVEGAAAAVTARASPKTNTLAWAIDRYRNHSAWGTLSPATRRQRENIFRKVIETAGSEPLNRIDEEAIREGRERRSTHPHAANNFLKTMRGFFAWAVSERLVKVDPTKGVKLLQGPNDADGFHTWSEEEVERFEKYWPIGTRERLAFAMLLYTGLRRGDVVRIGRQHLKDGTITLRTEKRSRKTREQYVAEIPLLPVLADIIARSTTGDLTFLVTQHGRPFAKAGFGNWFREAARKAGCPGAAHGLRKAGAVRAAENGATERQLMALYTWSTGKMAVHYTEKASRKRLAASAGQLLLPSSARTENKNARTLSSGAGAKRKTSTMKGA